MFTGKADVTNACMAFGGMKQLCFVRWQRAQNYFAIAFEQEARVAEDVRPQNCLRRHFAPQGNSTQNVLEFPCAGHNGNYIDIEQATPGDPPILTATGRLKRLRCPRFAKLTRLREETKNLPA